VKLEHCPSPFGGGHSRCVIHPIQFHGLRCYSIILLRSCLRQTAVFFMAALQAKGHKAVPLLIKQEGRKHHCCQVCSGHCQPYAAEAYELRQHQQKNHDACKVPGKGGNSRSPAVRYSREETGSEDVEPGQQEAETKEPRRKPAGRYEHRQSRRIHHQSGGAHIYYSRHLRHKYLISAKFKFPW